MTGNQTMDYYVWPRHLYSYSRTCTRSGLCRRLSRLVASLICYLLDRASVHEITALVTWFHCMSDISSHYGDLDLLYIFSLVEIMVLCISSSWRFWSMYIVRGDDHICSIMYHAYSWPLYSYVSGTARCICRLYAELYYGIMLIGWLVFHLGTFITSLLGWTYNVFRPSYNPSDLIH